MSIKDILKKVSGIAKYYRIDKPYIVGGLPRDIYLQKEIKTSDVDLTTNSSDVMRLGILTANEINSPFELSDDGHVTVFADEFDLDFSSNFISENVIEYLSGDYKGFEEAFSRDFTINTLHQDLETEEFFDPTGMAVEDIEKKLIRTPVPPEITLMDDPRRVYRAINLAVRYGFEIDDSIKNFILNNLGLFSSENIKDKYITLKINKALNIDRNKTIELLKDLGLFDKVPLVGEFKNTLIDNKILLDYFNYKKASLVARSWEEYSNQGPEYSKIEKWWKENYNLFPKYNSSDYKSWTKWYMNKYRNEWNRIHKGPKETLRELEEEVAGGSQSLVESAKDTLEEVQKNLPKLPFFFNKEIKESNGHYLANVSYGTNVDLVNISNDVKSFIKVLGETAKEMNAETPYITSGYRDIGKQARLMFYNWKQNGGKDGGRIYLTKIYGSRYGNQVADIFEQYGYDKRVIPIVEQFSSRHTRSPAQAIDLRITNGITDVLMAIKQSGRFNMKLVDERRTAGPHWHIAVYGDNLEPRLSKIKSRKIFLEKLAINING